jgi:RNA polymerase sigma-70 factor (ECF subfamily)
MMEYLETTDFIHDFAKGERKAFNEIYDQYFSRIYVSAIKIIVNQEEAKDITLETFNKLFGKYRDFDNLPEIRSFLYLTARNACFNYLKKLRRITEKQQQFIATYNDKEELANDQIEGELLHAVYKAIEKLPSESRKVIELMYLRGMKYKEIAEQLQISIETVKSQRKYALDKLRENLPTAHLLAVMVISSNPFLLKCWLSGFK